MSLDLGTGYYKTTQEVLNSVYDPAISALRTESNDAGFFRVSTIGGGVAASNDILVDGVNNAISATLTPISASPANTTAGLVTNTFQFDAGKLHVSALVGDAGLFRVSAIGGTAGDRTLVDGTTQTISATLTPISASPATTTAGLVTNNFQSDAGKLLTSAKQGDAGLFHTSAFVDSGSISARSGDGNQFHVSTVQGDAGLMRVSGFAFPQNFIVSAVVADAGTFRTSAFSPDAGLFHVSAVGNFLSANQQISAILLGGTANVGDVSAVQGDAGTLHVSAFVDSGSVSAKSTDANNLHTSAVQGDAGLQRVSAFTTYPSVFSGRTSASSGIPQALTSASTTSKLVYVTALSSNKGFVFMGDQTVSASSSYGYPLPPLAVMTSMIQNLSNLYLDVSAVGDGVSYIYYI